MVRVLPGLAVRPSEQSLLERPSFAGFIQECGQPRRDRYRPPFDTLAPTTLARARDLQSRIGAIGLQVSDFETGKLTDPRAGNRGDLD